MKKLYLILCIIVLIICISCTKKASEQNEITVYCYDSFVGDWGPGNKIAENFEKETGIHVNLISCSGSVQVYSKILLEGNKCLADAVIGLPDSINLNTSLFEELKPFDYGVFAFIYNTKDTSISIPTSLYDLAKPEYKNKIILVDPRTSSVGLGLLKWSYAALGNKFESWWTAVLDNALTVADSWSTAYGIFLENQAPLVISYSTSPVYHIINEQSNQYIAIEFNEGHIITNEYLAVLKNSNKKAEAEQFCEYILTKGQADIALANTMFPANKETELPEAYNSLINPKILIIDDKAFNDNLEKLQKQWEEIAVR